MRVVVRQGFYCIKDTTFPTHTSSKRSESRPSHLDLRLGGRQSRVVPTRWRLTESELEQAVRIVVLPHRNHMTSQVKVDARSAGARSSVLAVARRHGNDDDLECFVDLGNNVIDEMETEILSNEKVEERSSKRRRRCYL